MGAGELLLAGEVILSSQRSYEAPALFAVYSNQGLDGISAAFHSHLRARAIHPKRPRPLTLNVWEALYFDHNEAKMRELVDVVTKDAVSAVVTKLAV